MKSFQTGFSRSAIAFLVLASGCSGLRLADTLTITESDWPMFGRVATRTNATSEIVAPPLSLQWTHDVTGGIGNGSPLVVDSLVLVGNLRGELYGINANNGKRIGWIDIAEAIQGSPVIEGQTAYVAASNTSESLIAFHLLTGKVQWRRAYGDLEASPLLHNQRIYIGNTAGVFFCVDRATGDQIWQFEIGENTRLKGIRSSAAVQGNTILVGAEDGAMYALSDGTGALLWRVQTDGSIVGTPCIVDSCVYFGNLSGTMCALDLGTGSLRWKISTGSSIFAAPAAAGGSIFIGTTGGMMYGLNGSTGAIEWKTDLGCVINSAAVVSGQTLYIGTLKKFLFALDTADGTVRMKQEVPGRIKTSPAVARGHLYVATDERLILSFQGARQ